MSMKESEFQAWVVDVATRFGWRVWHVPTPMRPIGGNKFVPDQRGRGLPDLVLLHDDPPRLIFAEVKAQDGRLSVEQVQFLQLARGVADEVRAVARMVPLPSQSGLPAPPAEPTVGAYVWRPGVEDLIEATLRGKVLPA